MEVTQLTDKGGRPSLYKPEYAVEVIDFIEKTCATNRLLAAHFNVDPSTITRWMADIPQFAQAVTQARERLDSRVERSLAKRAIGYKAKATKIFRDNKTGEIVKVPHVEHYPPDTEAAKFWLTNRQPERWRNKQEIEHKGQMSEAPSAVEAARLIAFTLQLAQQQGAAPAVELAATPVVIEERVNPFAD